MPEINGEPEFNRTRREQILANARNVVRVHDYGMNHFLNDGSEEAAIISDILKDYKEKVLERLSPEDQSLIYEAVLLDKKLEETEPKEEQ